MLEFSENGDMMGEAGSDFLTMNVNGIRTKLTSLLVVAMLFSSMEVISKPLMYTMNPLFVTFVRFFIGGTFLMFLKKRIIPARAVVKLVFVGFTNTVIAMGALQLAVKYGTASGTATLIASNPIFVALLAPLIIKEKISIKSIFGIVLGFTGVLIMGRDMRMHDVRWLIFGLLAPFAFAIYTILMKPLSEKYDSLSVTAYSSFFSSLFYLPLLPFIIPPPSSFSFSNIAALIYLGLGVTGVAYMVYIHIVRSWGSLPASMVFFIKPPLSMILAFILLGETPLMNGLIGTILILGALVLVVRR